MITLIPIHIITVLALAAVTTSTVIISLNQFLVLSSQDLEIFLYLWHIGPAIGYTITCLVFYRLYLINRRAKLAELKLNAKNNELYFLYRTSLSKKSKYTRNSNCSVPETNDINLSQGLSPSIAIEYNGNASSATGSNSDMKNDNISQSNSIISWSHRSSLPWFVLYVTFCDLLIVSAPFHGSVSFSPILWVIATIFGFVCMFMARKTKELLGCVRETKVCQISKHMYV